MDIQSMMPNTSTKPVRTRRLVHRGRTGKMLLAAAVVVCLVGGGASWSLRASRDNAHADLLTHVVHYDTVQPSLLVHGNLEAVENTDIICRVKTRSSDGRSVRPTIRWIIEEGASVKKGQLLVQIDDSGWQEDLDLRKGPLEDARAAWLQAEENYKIVVSQNQADRLIADNAFRIADIELPKYVKGDYEQQRRDLEGRISMAEAAVSQWEERVANTQRLARLGYRSERDARVERDSMRNARIDLDRLRMELSVLKEYGYPRTVTELEGKLAEARRNLDILKRQAHSKELQAEIDRLSKKRIYQRRLRRYHEIEEEVAKCRITAPHDGLVVYCAPPRAARVSNQAFIAQGQEVREGQRLMRIPNLHRMVVNVLVPERQLRGVDSGDQALIRIEAFPDRVLHGHVKRLAELPSQVDWFLSDSRLYPAQITVEESIAGLLPDMSAEVTILVDPSVNHILTVPVAALIGPAYPGATDKCYVLTPEGPEERDVVVGASDEKAVEIRAGLHEGDEVVLNPRSVHEETEASPPTNRSSAGVSP